jgi:serralysin
MAIFSGTYGDDTKTGDYVYMDGGLGNDVLRDTHPGGVQMLGGGGWDFLAIDYINDPNTFGLLIGGGAGNDVVYGGAGKDNIFGRSGDDYVVTHGRGAKVDGGTGRDKLVAGEGSSDVVFHGGDGNDKGLITVHDENRQPFTVAAGLYGSVGNDRLFGDDGNDLLVGGLGQDDLEGGDGKDIFRFVSTADSLPGGSNRDVINDFDPSKHDRIDVSLIDANEGAIDDQAFKFIGSRGFHDRAGELQFKNGILRGDTNGDGHADFEIKVHVTGSDDLGRHDLVL